MAAVTSYHKIGGLEQQKFILSQFWRPEVQNQYHWAAVKELAGLSSLWTLQEGVLLTSPSFHGCSGHPGSWLHHSSSAPSSHHHRLPHNPAVESLIKTLVVGCRAHPENLDNHLKTLNMIKSGKTLVPNKVTFTGPWV